ncbi:MAG: bifunctional DNA-formamidopyrimidine glycosylase/DNA-(apurinic or apyrimidinic site) lyase [Thermoanaerobaculum sp.]|nr:bifunctional DNA-formamidopyrimidine glycosylase/DNA-(apurinic or apyrimidinic site) lyase [Thermoanaerobaculum sp.]
MPELPEVETIRRGLLARLGGRELQQVQVFRGDLRRPVNTAELTGLAGARLEGITRRGKYLVFSFSSARALLLHLGMSGRLHLAFSAHTRPPHTHLVFRFAGDCWLLFVDPRRFGLVKVVPTGSWAEDPLLAALGPEPSHPEAVAAALERVARGRGQAVRDLLLDQRVVAGVGNIYANEALFAARIRPQRRSRELSRKDLWRLAVCLKQVVEEALQAGGTTLADGGFRNASGEPGFFSLNLWVYSRHQQPCRRCQTPIRRIVLSGRSAYFCPRCQR